MILVAGNRKYEVVRHVLSGEKNEVMVCMILQEKLPEYKTIWRVKDRELTKKLLKLFGEREEKGVCEGWFVEKKDMHFVFPYRGERPIEKFYLSTVSDGSVENTKIWLELISACMTDGLPTGILYLVLKQGQAGLTPEGAVFFNYFLDLSDYREDRGEQEIAMLCAGVILKLAGAEQTGVEIPGRLLEKKLGRKAYTDCFQLYQDIKMLAENRERNSFLKNIQNKFSAGRDVWIKVLCVFCAVLFFTAAGTFLIRALGGERAFVRLKGHTFERIGTESLLQ